MSLQCIFHSYTSYRLSQEINEKYYQTCDLFLENKIKEAIQQTGEKLLICDYAYNKQKHRSNLFLKNHLAGFIQSSRIIMKKFKKGLALPKGNCLTVTNELEENPMSCSRSQSFCVTKIFVLSVMKPQTSATVWMLHYHKEGVALHSFLQKIMNPRMSDSIS